MGRIVGTRSRPALATATREQTGQILRLSKRQLEIRMARMLTLDNPNVSLEQYPVSPEVGAELLFMAGFEHKDIQDRRVIDLGTGTGRLAIGAALLGARKVVGSDLDSISIEVARKNAAATGVEVEWVVGDVEGLTGPYDTVVMNPPYGTREEHADTKFLEAAIRLAPDIYSIHKSSTRDYLTRFIKRGQRRVDVVRSMSMQLPHIYSFHRKKRMNIDVDLYRITSSETILAGREIRPF